MANTNAPFGFRQVAGTGSNPTYELNTEYITSTTAAIFSGDPVCHITDGSVAGNTTSPLPGTTTPIAGIFFGCKYLSTAQKRTVWNNYWPGSDLAAGISAEAYVINDPDMKLVAQSGNSTTGGFSQSGLGNLYQFSYNLAGQVSQNSTSTGQSAAYIDVTTVSGATTAGTYPFRLVGLVTSPGNSTYTTGAYNTGIFKWNNQENYSTNSPA